MNSFAFIAWSLAVGGVAAIVIFGAAQVMAVARGKPPHIPKPVELVLSIVLSLFLGAMTMRLIDRHALHVQPPRWNGLLDGGMFLTLGLWHLASARRDGLGYSSSRTLGYFLAGMGVLLLALEVL